MNTKVKRPSALFDEVHSFSKGSLKEASQQQYDVVIIGGGISGAGVARELALRGKKVALFDKGDFASGTSSASSKLAHGGLRYLEQFEFGLVFEACRERERLKKNAPHLVKEHPFLIPIYTESELKKWKLHLGLTFYDMMASFFKCPKHQMLSAQQAIEMQPQIKKEGLLGAALYYDAVMDDARLCLEAILQAEMFGADIFNYVQVVDMYHQQHRISHIIVEDCETNEQFCIKGDFFINTTGPFCDEYLSQVNVQHHSILRPSKGVHLIVNKHLTDQALLLESKNKRLFFVIPWDNQTLVGTTDTEYEGNIQDVTVTEEDKDYLLDELSRFFPESHFTDRDISSSFVGIRPLVKSKSSTQDISKVSRKDTLITHLSNFVSIIGGKYTTFRAMGERMVRRLQHVLHLHFKPLTGDLPFYGGEISDLDRYVNQHYQIEKEIFSISEHVYRHILNHYGSMYHKVFSVICEKPEFKQPLTESKHLKGEVVYAIRYEHAKKLEDFFRRRTQLYFQAHHGLPCLDEVTDLYQSELGWTDSEKESRKAAFREKITGLSQGPGLFDKK